MAARGRFISFEGIDGSGKSTQARLLADLLRQLGHDVVLTREPGGSPGAEEIRRLLLQGDPDRWSAETEILLFTAARRDHLEETIRPALTRGDIVITDRFADSTRMYQGLSRSDLLSLVDRLHEMMIGVEPDLTVLIDIDPKVGLQRSLARLSGLEAHRAASHAAAAASHTAAAATAAADQKNVAFAAKAAADAAAAAARSRSIATAASMIEQGEMPEDRFETFGELFQEKMRYGFLELAARQPDRFVVIDGAGTPQAVAERVAAAVSVRLDG
jgi:dTMP kinase